MDDKIQFIEPESDKWLDIELNDANENDENGKENTNKDKLESILLSSMQMQNIVVLAGSGTSLSNEGGGPSMSDLWNSCTKKNGNGTDQNTIEASSVFSLVGYDAVNKQENENIEELLSLCEAYLQIDTKKDSEDRKKVEKFSTECKKTILDKCRFNKEENFLSSHKTFIHRLSRRRIHDSRLKVFTTNYDTCFEEAANQQGIIIIDGFSFAQPRRYDPSFFDYDIVRRNENQDNQTPYLEGVFKLFKLHGSVNWKKDLDGNIQELEADAENSCIIFPAKGKYQQSYIQPHLEIMARYLMTLRKPNTCLIIIGFGFNDDHLSEPIIAAIKSNPHLKTIICDPNAKNNIKQAGKKYWQNLDKLRKSGEQVYFIESSFNKFSKLIPDLRALTPSEKLAQNIKQIAGITE